MPSLPFVCLSSLNRPQFSRFKINLSTLSHGSFRWLQLHLIYLVRSWKKFSLHCCKMRPCATCVSALPHVRPVEIPCLPCTPKPTCPVSSLPCAWPLRFVRLLTVLQVLLAKTAKATHITCRKLTAHYCYLLYVVLILYDLVIVSGIKILLTYLLYFTYTCYFRDRLGFYARFRLLLGQ